MQEEKRRHQRIPLPQPLRGSVSGLRVFLIDISIGGFRITHRNELPAKSDLCELQFDSPHGPLHFQCRITNRKQELRPAVGGEQTVFETGLQLKSGKYGSEQTLRDLIHERVNRALDEQKANARGIPAIAAASYQTGGSRSFIRYEFLGFRWKKTPTSEPRQPLSGFTISSREPADQVAMLCQAFECSDAEGQKLIRSMAECTIANPEGVPTRKYTP